MTIGIYIITNNINKKKYVGQSIDINRRLKNHFSSSNKTLLGHSIVKYGKNNFSIEIIETEKHLLDEVEKQKINELDCIHPNGYNMLPGGKPYETLGTHLNKGRKCSEETKQKLRIINLGKKHSDETKQKQSEIMTGRVRTPEHQEKLNKARTGQKRTVEQRQRMSNAQTGIKHPKERIEKGNHRKRLQRIERLEQFPNILYQIIIELKNRGLSDHKISIECKKFGYSISKYIVKKMHEYVYNAGNVAFLLG